MEIDRALASIRRIAGIRPIEGADNIVCATVDGWELVTQKSNGFKTGDLVVYFEIDSVLPEKEPFEFLRERCYVSTERSVNGAGFRLRTIKLRGQVSQGLILPISELDHLIYDGDHTSYEEGTDLTEILGVVKYEKPLAANLAGVARGNFPTFIPKTDETRVQNACRILEKAWDHQFEVSIKLDGSSCTIYEHDGKFGVCSRNLDLEETEGNSFWQVARKYDLPNKLGGLGHFKSIAIQGELMGPGVQGNPEDLKELDLFVFNVYDIEGRKYFNPHDRGVICKVLGLKHVPVLEYRTFDTFTISDFVAYADGPSLNEKKNREGLVFKSQRDPSISFKAISNKWLLKNDG